ncbi:hypothetical protein [Haloferax sp. Q22]|uniref:hypothetical protein n=1 Tax=Haloferax sp. (strain Q22) TaxID=1526048 RepID=UPI0012FA5654|nr:hypothetical protein [Haloferax sp. Q22]
MRPEERFAERVRGAFAGMVLTLLATVAGRIMEAASQTQATSEFSVGLISSLITSFPGLVTLAGIIGATVLAGPFGFIGAIMETVGASQLLNNPGEGSIWLIFLGAGLVTVGSLIPWLKVFSVMFGSNSRY